MQFVPIPLLAFGRPTYTMPSFTQIMSLALATDFKKFILARSFNELYQSKKSEKCSENAQTNISTISLEDVIQRKIEQKQAEPCQKKNRKSKVLSQKKIQHDQKNHLFISKKRQSFQKARLQITQALEYSQEINYILHGERAEQKEEKINLKSNSQSSNCNRIVIVPKQKKIKKAVRIQKVQKNIIVQSGLMISTSVSLIDTIDHPIINMDRIEIQRKKQNLLQRAIFYNQLQMKKYNYQIRQRRELKKLN